MLSVYVRQQKLKRRATDDLGLEVDSHDSFNSQSLDEGLDGLMAGAFLIVVLHVLEAGELSFGDQSVALRARISLSRANRERQDIRLAILVKVQCVSSMQKVMV